MEMCGGVSTGCAIRYANTFITNLLNRTTDRTTPHTSSGLRHISWAGDTLQDIETVNDGKSRCTQCTQSLTVATEIPMGKSPR